MNKIKEKQIIRIVSDLWKKYSLTPGFDVKKLIKDLSIQYEERIFSEGLSGLLMSDINKTIICIHQSHAENRKRFSAGHELGHFFLHKDSSITLDKNVTVYLRDEDSSKGTYIKEIEANYFAATLLMPENEITKSIDLEIDLEQNIEILAPVFKVSPESMAIRLSRLGYL